MKGMGLRGSRVVALRVGGAPLQTRITITKSCSGSALNLPPPPD